MNKKHFRTVSVIISVNTCEQLEEDEEKNNNKKKQQGRSILSNLNVILYGFFPACRIPGFLGIFRKLNH